MSAVSVSSIQIIEVGDPAASEAELASSEEVEVPSHGQEVRQDASQGAEVSSRQGAQQDASQEAGASRSQAGAASLLGDRILVPADLAACEAGDLRVEAASGPWGVTRAGPGAAEAWHL